MEEGYMEDFEQDYEADFERRQYEADEGDDIEPVDYYSGE